MRESADGDGVFEELRGLGWGRAEELMVVAGVPLIGRGTKLFKRVRVAARAPVIIAAAPPFEPGSLHRSHLGLLAHCRAMGRGVIARVEIADGLPVFWT